MKSPITSLLVIVFLFLGVANPVMAQPPTPTPTPHPECWWVQASYNGQTISGTGQGNPATVAWRIYNHGDMSVPTQGDVELNNMATFQFPLEYGTGFELQFTDGVSWSSNPACLFSFPPPTSVGLQELSAEPVGVFRVTPDPPAWLVLGSLAALVAMVAALVMASRRRKTA